MSKMMLPAGKWTIDFVWFDGISTIVGYLIPNPFLYKQFYLA